MGDKNGGLPSTPRLAGGTYSRCVCTRPGAVGIDLWIVLWACKNKTHRSRGDMKRWYDEELRISKWGLAFMGFVVAVYLVLLVGLAL